MTETIVFPRKLLKQFIQLYGDSPCLWNRNVQEYKEKYKKTQAITKLTDLVRQYDPSASRVHVLRKIESFRACIRREHKKVLESRACATCPEEVYVPHLWYYNNFSFLFEEDEDDTDYKPVVPVSNPILARQQLEIHTLKQETDVEEVRPDIDEDDTSNLDQEQTMQEEYDVNLVDVVDSHSSTSKRLIYIHEDEQKPKRSCTEVSDEYDAIGVNVAAKLRTLPSNMRIVAEKLINDVLFQAQVGGLNSSSKVFTKDPIDT